MKTSFLILVFPCIFVACKKSGESLVTPPTTDINLLTNGSFESNGVPSLQTWRGYNPNDTTRVSFSTDVPPQGGYFSLRLKNEWTFAGGVIAVVPAFLGTHQYRLSAYAKCEPYPRAHGYMTLGFLQSDSLVKENAYFISDSGWVACSLIDTLSASSGDSILVGLAGDIFSFAVGYTFFDLCKLEKLD